MTLPCNNDLYCFKAISTLWHLETGEHPIFKGNEKSIKQGSIVERGFLKCTRNNRINASSNELGVGVMWPSNSTTVVGMFLKIWGGKNTLYTMHTMETTMGRAVSTLDLEKPRRRKNPLRWGSEYCISFGQHFPHLLTLAYKLGCYQSKNERVI